MPELPAAVPRGFWATTGRGAGSSGYPLRMSTTIIAIFAAVFTVARLGLFAWGLFAPAAGDYEGEVSMFG